jgi:hypothetical protein
MTTAPTTPACDEPRGGGTSCSTRPTHSRVRASSSRLAAIGSGARGCASVIVPAPIAIDGQAPVVEPTSTTPSTTVTPVVPPA